MLHPSKRFPGSLTHALHNLNYASAAPSNIQSRRIHAPSDQRPIFPRCFAQDARWRRGEAVSLEAARNSMVSLEAAAHSQLAFGKKA